MSPEKYDNLWDKIILREINDYVLKHSKYELAVPEAKLKDDIWKAYEEDYKPAFKGNYMSDDSEGEDETLNGKKIIKLDRHKVAALLYLSMVCNDGGSFMRLKGGRDPIGKFSEFACYEIAYSVSLNCMDSFIRERFKQDPDCEHKNKFLSNNGFEKQPHLICEKYANSYRESIIPRTMWAAKEISLSFESYTVSVDSIKSRRVAANANMLANIFYFLELYSAS